MWVHFCFQCSHIPGFYGAVAVCRVMGVSPGIWKTFRFSMDFPPVATGLYHSLRWYLLIHSQGYNSSQWRPYDIAGRNHGLVSCHLFLLCM